MTEDLAASPTGTESLVIGGLLINGKSTFAAAATQTADVMDVQPFNFGSMKYVSTLTMKMNFPAAASSAAASSKS